MNNKYIDNPLRYKVNFDITKNILDIQIFKDTFYLKLDNINLLNKKQILDSLNLPFKNKFIDKDEYASILNYITFELCLSRLNEKLYHELYFTLCRKNILDNNTFDILFNQK